jgi:biopolymer transport protein ExbD
MDERPFDTLNVIPFVDIMLVLLTIVLTTANFIATGRIPITLPQASQSQIEKQDKMIELTAAGAIYLDGVPVSQSDLESQLSGLPSATSFLIRADKDIAFQKFIDVADALKRLKFNKVAIQTRTVGR